MSRCRLVGARFRLKTGFVLRVLCHREPYCADAQAVLTETQDYGLNLPTMEELVLPGQRIPPVAGRARVPAEADSGERFRGGKRVGLMVSSNSGEAKGSAGCPVG